jgi:hypothetical protein
LFFIAIANQRCALAAPHNIILQEPITEMFFLLPPLALASDQRCTFAAPHNII